MTQFRIIYEQEIHNSNNPLDAAKRTLEGITGGDALCFEVENLGTGEKFSVDLNEDDEDAVSPM